MSQLLAFYRQNFQQGALPQHQNLQPTFEDLTIDDNLTELQRLVRYSRSAIGLQRSVIVYHSHISFHSPLSISISTSLLLHRLVHVKMLASIAINVGFIETNAQILPLLSPISRDSEPAVRQHLLEQLFPLAQFCCTKGLQDGGYDAVISSILPVISLSLEDEKPEVRRSACASLVAIAQIMKPDDLGQHVLTIVLHLAHEDEKEDKRMTAAELLNSLAESLGSDLCKQFVIPEVSCFDCPSLGIVYLLSLPSSYSLSNPVLTLT